MQLADIMEFRQFLVPGAIMIGTIVVLLVIRAALLKVFLRWASQTSTRIDEIIVKSFRVPSIYWVVAVGIYVGVGTSALPERYVYYLNKTIFILIILSFTFATASLSGRIFTNYIQKMEVPLPTTGLAQGIIKGSILVVGFLIVLTVLGISITPMITALGVGGLAVALAFQDTLANLFAGIHILVEKSIRVGDFIKLESGEQGYVQDITWRTTRIRMLPNNVVVIPNSKLSQSIVTNFYLPEKKMSLLIPIGVSYSSDPEYVIKVVTDEAMKAIGEVPGLLGQPEGNDPFVRFIPGYGESSLDFTLICQVREFVDQYLVQDELRKLIWKRFKREGIEIPFPHRTVYLREEKDWETKEAAAARPNDG